MKQLLFAMLLLIVLTFAGCFEDGDKIDANKEIAAAQVATIHEQYNKQDVAAIVAGSDVELFKVVSKEVLTKSINNQYTNLGKVTISTVQKNLWGYTNNMQTFTVIQDTSYEKGKGVETYTFRVIDGKAKLLGYRILIAGERPH
ncbi:MAG: hypothetical protein WCJ56_13315 [bacterium]